MAKDVLIVWGRPRGLGDGDDARQGGLDAPLFEKPVLFEPVRIGSRLLPRDLDIDPEWLPADSALSVE